MSCVICTNPFAEGDKKTESPCGCIGHTSCAFRILSEYLLGYSRHPLDCPSCRNQIYRHSWLDQRDADAKSAKNRILTLKENNEFNKDLSSIKKKLTSSKKAIANFKKYLAPKKTQFKNEIKPHIDLIKSYHKRYSDAAKQEPVYKLANRLNSAYRFSLTRFINKYDLSDDAINLLKLDNSYRQRRCYWNNSPLFFIKRSFRLRLYL
jgi:hypothetical protein